MRRVIENWANSKYTQGQWGKCTFRSAIQWGERFASYIEKHYGSISVQNITQKHIEEYCSQKFPSLKENSQAQERDWLRSLFNWCQTENVIVSNPIINWKPIQINKTERTVLSTQQIKTILDSVDISTMGGVQDRVIIEVFYTTAIRRLELVNLNLEDIDLHQKKITINNGKNKKDRILPILPSTLNCLKVYITEVRPHITKTNTNALFIGRAGARISTAHISRLMKKLRQKTNIETISPHILRHSCATHLMENGVAITYIQKLLGHENISTTQEYLHINHNYKINYNLPFPRDKINT